MYQEGLNKQLEEGKQSVFHDLITKFLDLHCIGYGSGKAYD